MIVEIAIAIITLTALGALGRRADKTAVDDAAARAARAAALLDEARAFIAQIESDRQFPALEAPLLNLPLNEFVALHQPETVMLTYLSHQVGVGEIGGIGGIGAHPREWRTSLDLHMTTIATGDLYLTNRRMVYVGDRRSMSLLWRDLMALTCGLDGLHINTDDSPIPIAFKVKNSLLWAMLIKWMSLVKVEGRALAPGAHLEMNPEVAGDGWIVNAVLSTGDP